MWEGILFIVSFSERYREKEYRETVLICLCWSKLSNIHILAMHICTPYYRLSRLQMSSGTQTINKLNEILVSTFNVCLCWFFKFRIFILWHVFILYVNKCCIDHLFCMVDVFRLSGNNRWNNHWRQTSGCEWQSGTNCTLYLIFRNSFRNFKETWQETST